MQGADTTFVVRIVPDRATAATDQGPLIVNRIVTQHEGFGRRLLDDEQEEMGSELGLDGGDTKKRRGRRLAEDDTYDRLALQMSDLIDARLSGGKGTSEPKVAFYNEEDKEEASRRLKNYKGGKPNSRPTWGGGSKPSWGSKPTWNEPVPTPTWGSGTKPTWNAPVSTTPTRVPTKVSQNTGAARCKTLSFRLADCQTLFKPPTTRSLGRCRVSADKFSVIYSGNGYIGEYRCTYEVMDAYGATAQADIFLDIVIGPTVRCICRFVRKLEFN